ncbi:hypothetical protein VAWG005_41650 [Aeromonas dhakensis]|nr:hypothetical protein VAWG003_41630 [Aeromonas dhakensis]BEE28237.1 hypothetical protein VAWG005_41650 [Aeromonas dhakensis]
MLASGEPGIPPGLDGGSQLHFYLVAFVGQTGLYAGTDRGCVGVRGARHPVLLRQLL